MKAIVEEFSEILNEEDKILDELSAKQKVLRNSVNEKNWEKLIKIVSEINLISDSFQSYDSKREKIQYTLSASELQPYHETLLELHSKLLRCKAENKALGSLVNITRMFVQQVIEKALPQSRNKNYSRNGHIVNPQPQSVVVNQLF